MKSVKDIRVMIEKSRLHTTEDGGLSGTFASNSKVLDILLAMLDHIDTLNGRTDIMREVAEGDMEIVRKSHPGPSKPNINIPKLHAIFARKEWTEQRMKDLATAIHAHFAINGAEPIAAGDDIDLVGDWIQELKDLWESM